MAGERMLVDVKLNLPSKRDAEIVRAALQGGLLSVETQENHFFDTTARALISQGSLLRVRHCVTAAGAGGSGGGVETACVAIKEHAHVDCGSQVVWAGQDQVAPSVARELLHSPQELYNIQVVPKVASLLRQGLSPDGGSSLPPLVYLGSFQNHREEFSWPGCRSQPGLTIRLDETSFPFGLKYELEVPGITVPVQDVVDELTEVLQSLGASFSLGAESKFVCFLNGVLRTNSASHMVQEVKLRLQNESDLSKLASLLANDFVSEDTQENFFFDGLNGELSGKKSFFRVRAKNNGQTITCVVKEHQEVEDGTQLCWTQEVRIEYEDAKYLLAAPRDLHETSKFLQTQSPIAVALREKFLLTGLRFVGSFRTHRATYNWTTSTSQPIGLSIKLDKTSFPFGAHYEVEVSQIRVPVHDVLDELSGWLSASGIPFQVSTQSKLECFMDGCQKNFMNAHNVVI